MRVLFVAGYQHESYHRKVELLAASPDVELHHVTVEGYGRTAGAYPAADGSRAYTVQTFPAHSLGAEGDPHRAFLWPGHFDLGRFKPDIVHAESDLEVLGTAQLSAARALLAPRSRLVLYTWQNLVRPRRPIVRWLVAFNLRSASHILAASREAEAVLRRQGYWGPASVIPLWGLDSRVFYPRPAPALRAALGAADADILVGYVGRLSPEKGLDTLIRAFAAVAPPPTSSSPGASASRIRLVLVGSGPQEAELRAQASTLGVADGVRFVPKVAYEAVADYINAMDILVLPSQTTTHWKEQFGRVLVEAMGCRKPVVGSDSGAIPEVVGDGGVIVPEGDAGALAAALGHLAEDAKRRADLGEHGYRRALAEYSVERVAERTLAVWRTLVPR